MRRWIASGAVLLLTGACGGEDSSDTVAAPATTAAFETTTSTAATTTVPETTTSSTVADVLTAPTFAVPYRFSSPEVDLVKNMGISDGWIDYRSGTGQFVLFTTGGPDSTEGWVEMLTSDPRLDATEPTETNVGGLTATTIDVRLIGEEFNLFFYAPAPGENAAWGVAPESVDRVHLVDVNGRTVVIIIEASEAEFDAFAAAIDVALATLEWNPVVDY